MSDGDAQRIVADIVRDAELSLTPYYLSLARVLARLGKLSSPADDEDARLWLLGEYRDALAAGSVRPDAGPSPLRRREVLKDLEAIAFVRVLGTRKEAKLAQELERLGAGRIDVESVLAAVRRLGVVEDNHDGRVDFAHPTTLAYFASGFLVDHKAQCSTWDLIMDEAWGPFRAQTLIFATIAACDDDLANYVCNRLLQHASAADGAFRNGLRAGSNWLATALEIAHCGGSVDKQTANALLSRVQTELEGAKQLGREQAGMLKSLGKLCEKLQLPDAYETLWRFATLRGDYSFRRQATKAITQGSHPTDALLPTIDDVMGNAKRYEKSLTKPADDDRDEPFDSLRAVAWILPSLRSVSRPGAKKDKLNRYQEDLLTFAGRFTVQLGLQASVAQGLKFDAVRDPLLPPDPFALKMLRPGKDRAEFWFSRVLLVQALARRQKQDPTGEASSMIAAARRDEHEFVRQTAKLCMRAIVDDRPERFLLEDLTEVTGRAPYDLAARTSQLIGDIVLALNLNEYGGPASRRVFGSEHRLPACLTATRRRREVVLLEVDRPGCPFADYQDKGCLCPYTEDPPKDGNRRELTRAFCRHQRLNARRLPWNSGIRSRHLRDFWAKMEDLARY